MRTRPFPMRILSTIVFCSTEITFKYDQLFSKLRTGSTVALSTASGGISSGSRQGAKNPPFRNRLVGAKTSPLEFSRDLVDNFRLLEKNPISAENGRPVATKS